MLTPTRSIILQKKDIPIKENTF